MKTSQRAALLTGVSSLALLGALVPTAATAANQVTFTNNSVGTTSTSAGLLSLVASQINNSLLTAAPLTGSSAAIDLNTSTGAGAQAVSSNVFAATAVGNTVALPSSASTSLNLANIPSGGAASAGISQTNNFTSTSAVAAAIGQTITSGGQINTGSGTVSGNSASITGSGQVTTPVTVSGNTFAATAGGNDSTVNAQGSLPVAGVAGQNASVNIGPNTLYNNDVTRYIEPNVNYLANNNMGGDGAANHTGAGYSLYTGAPGASGNNAGNSNTTASLTIGSQVNPNQNPTVGGAIAVGVVQSNTGLNGGTGTSPTASISSRLDTTTVRAGLTGGTSGTSATVADNTLAAATNGNSANSGINILSGGASSFGGGAAVLTSQSNSSTANALLSADNTASTVRIDGGTTPATFSGSSLSVATNTISAATSGNTATNSVRLDSAVTAGGSNAAATGTLATNSGTSTVTLTDYLADPTNYSTNSANAATLDARFGAGNWTTVTYATAAQAQAATRNPNATAGTYVKLTFTDSTAVGAANTQSTTADYVVASQQRNLGSISATERLTATTNNASVGITGGQTSGSASVTGNVLDASAVGNRTTNTFGGLTSTAPVSLASGASVAVTNIQANEGVLLAATTGSASAASGNTVSITADGTTPAALTNATLALNGNTASSLAVANTANLSAQNVQPANGSTTARGATVTVTPTTGTVDYSTAAIDFGQTAPTSLSTILGSTVYGTTTTGIQPKTSSAPAGGSTGFAANIAVVNQQTNQTGTTANATTQNNNFAVTGTAASGITGGSVHLDSNLSSATAALNAASLSASLAAGGTSTYYGGILLANGQGNVLSAANQTTASTVTNNAATVTAIQTDANASTAGNQPGAMPVTAPVSVSGNNFAASTLGNQASLALNTPAGVTAAGATAAANTLALDTTTVNPVQAGAAYALANVQRNARVPSDTTSTAVFSATSNNNTVAAIGAFAGDSVSLAGNGASATTQANTAGLSANFATLAADASVALASRQENALPTGVSSNVIGNALRIATDRTAAGSTTSFVAGAGGLNGAAASITSTMLDSQAMGNRASLGLAVADETGTASPVAGTVALALGRTDGANNTANNLSTLGGTRTLNSLQNSTDLTASAGATSNVLEVQTTTINGGSAAIGATGQGNLIRGMAELNLATLSATLGSTTSSDLTGGVALANSQNYVTTPTSADAVASANSNTLQVQAGTSSSAGSISGPVSIASNTIAGVARGNDASLSLTAQSGAVVGGTSTASNTLRAGSTTANAVDASGAYVLANLQAQSGSAALATADIYGSASNNVMRADGSFGTPSVSLANNAALGVAQANNASLSAGFNRLDAGASVSLANRQDMAVPTNASAYTVSNQFLVTTTNTGSNGAFNGTTASLSNNAAVASTAGNQASVGLAVGAEVGTANASATQNVTLDNSATAIATGRLTANSLQTLAGSVLSASSSTNAAQIVTANLATNATLSATGTEFSASTSGNQLGMTADLANASGLRTLNSRQVLAADSNGNGAKVNAQSDSNTIAVDLGAGISTGSATVSGSRLASTALGNDATQAATLSAVTSVRGGVAVQNTQEYSGGASSGDIQYGASTSNNTVRVASLSAGGVAQAASSADLLAVGNNFTALAAGNRAGQSLSAGTSSTLSGVGGTAAPATLAQSGNFVSASGDYVLANRQLLSDLGNTGTVSTSANQVSVVGGVTAGLAAAEGNTFSGEVVGNRYTGSMQAMRTDGTADLGIYSSQATSGTGLHSTVSNNGVTVSNIGTSGSGVSTASSTVSVSGNTVSGTATLNDATLSATGLAQTTTTARGNASMDVSGSGAGTLTTAAPVAVASTQLNSLSSNSDVTLSSNSFLATNNATGSTADTVLVNGNRAVAALTGNSVTSTVALDGSTLGSGVFPGGLAATSTQANTTSTSGVTLAASNTGTTIAFDSGAGGSAAQTLGSSTVSVAGNTIGASVTGNYASRSLDSSSLVNSTGGSSAAVGSTTASRTTSGSGSVLNVGSADYVNAGVQRNTGSSSAPLNMTASVSNASIGAGMGGSNAPVNVRNNTVAADAAGNSMLSTTGLARSSLATTQVASMQSNTYTNVSAAVSGTSIGLSTTSLPGGGSLTSGMLSASPSVVAGNTVRATAQGNVLRASVGGI